MTALRPLRRGRFVLCGALLTGACQVPAPMDAAEARVRRGELGEALLWLDRVTPQDPAYAEARNLAGAVERRMRVAQRLVKEALDLRAERRDEPARDLLLGARRVWPELPGIDVLIRATEFRMASIEPSIPDAEANGGTLHTRTLMPGVIELGSDPLAAPAAETGAAQRAPVEARAAAGEVQDAAKRLLAEGRIDAAIRLLEPLRSAASDPGLDQLWLTALRRRSLAAYARGDLQGSAIAWRSVLDTNPQDALAAAYLESIRAELALRPAARFVDQAPDND